MIFFILENFSDGFTSSALRTNTTLQYFPTLLAAGSSTVQSSSGEISHFHFWHKPKLVEGMSATSVLHQVLSFLGGLKEIVYMS